MGAIILHRIDPALNMRRFYRLDVQPDLFGFWCLVREWGRLGQAGQVRIVSYPTKDAAEAALQQLRKVKERRGYAAGAIRERQVGVGRADENATAGRLKPPPEADESATPVSEGIAHRQASGSC